MSNIQRLAGGRRENSSKKKSVNEDETDTSPLDSLRSQKHEEFSCQDCLLQGVKCFYDFTIASCNYAFCNCLNSKRNGYENLELGNSSGSTTSTDVESEIEDMKARLKFHFMNPFQKWKNHERRRFPWKLITQLLALIVVTTQLWINATQKYQLNLFVDQNVDTFEQLFVLNPQDADPATDYYQTSATSLIITKDDFWNQLNYTALRYYSIRKIAVGPFGYKWADDPKTFNSNDTPVLTLHVEHYKAGKITPETKKYSFKGHKMKKIYNITNPAKEDIKTQLENSILSDEFDSVIALWLKFSLSSVYLDSQSNPLCCQFDITLEMKNRIHSGSMPVSLSTETTIEGCSANNSAYDPATGLYDPSWTTAIDCIVLVLMLVSTLQCVRSILKAGRFTKEVRTFFRKRYDYKLSLSQYLPLYNWWFVGVVISNSLVIIGTVLFLITSYTEVHHLELDDIVSIIYGIGVFLQWCGLLRFLSYFDKYNILLITLRLALPSVIRFMVCGFIFYVSFLLLGWLVLGPYHPKFRDPSVTSECLFSLINGDDMFNTYIQMENLSLPAFIFSKIYLYIFISLFIYVVLSVFISLISDTYETLHEEWSIRSKGLLWDFAHDRSAKTRARGDSETQYEILTGSMYSNEGSPVVTNGGPLLPRVSNRNTPTLQIPLSNPNSPQIPKKRSLYPDLDSRPQIRVEHKD